MKITTSITVDEEILNQIDYVAKIEDRTRSGMIKVIIKDWLKARPGIKEVVKK